MIANELYINWTKNKVCDEEIKINKTISFTKSRAYKLFRERNLCLTLIIYLSMIKKI